MDALLAFKGEQFSVLSGDDATACRAMLTGADGVISVASNVLPRAFRRLCDLARGGRDAEAKVWDARLAPTYDFFGIEPNPIPVKALLEMAGIGHGLRLPLTALSSEHLDTAARVAGIVRELESACRDTVSA